MRRRRNREVLALGSATKKPEQYSVDPNENIGFTLKTYRSQKINILLAEDEIDYGNGIKRALETGPFEVTLVRNALTALRLVEEQYFGALVVDMTLEHRSTDFALHMINKPIGKRAPIILISGDLSNKIFFDKRKVEAFLLKGFKVKELSDCILRVVDKSNKELF